MDTTPRHRFARPSGMRIVAVGILVLPGFAFGAVTGFHPWIIGLFLLVEAAVLIAPLPAVAALGTYTAGMGIAAIVAIGRWPNSSGHGHASQDNAFLGLALLAMAAIAAGGLLLALTLLIFPEELPPSEVPLWLGALIGGAGALIGGAGALVGGWWLLMLGPQRFLALDTAGEFGPYLALAVPVVAASSLLAMPRPATRGDATPPAKAPLREAAG